MNKKDMTRLKKMLGDEEACPIERVASCYVEAGSEEIRYQPATKFSMVEDEEAEQYVAFAKKGVTGKPGSTALDLEPEDNELDALRRTKLEDEEAIRRVCEKIMESYPSEENYGVFLMYGNCDVPSDSPKTSDDDPYAGSDETYEFVAVMIQPCALSKAGIVYDGASNGYRDRKRDRPLSPPVHSFLFPSFTEGHADVSTATYFSKNAKAQTEGRPVVEALLGTTVPLTVDEQKDGFAGMMTAGFGASIPFDAAKEVFETFAERRAAAESEGDPTDLTADEVRDVIERCGADDSTKEALDEAFGEFDGKNFSLDVIAPKTVSVTTDAATVKVELNELPDVDVIEYKGQRCLVIPLYGASVENMNVR